MNAHRSRLPLLGLVLLSSAALASGGAQDRRLQEERAAIAERLARQESGCYQQFAVSDCLRRVRQQERSDLDALRRQENAAKEQVRLERSAEHQKALQQKREAAASAVPAPPSTQSEVSTAHRQSQSAPPARTPAAVNKVLAERAAKQRARAVQARVARQKLLEKQRAAAEREASRTRRQAARGGKGGPAIAPLPTPE